MYDNLTLLTPERIHLSIANRLERGAGYIEALCDYCKESGAEIETVAEIVRRSSVMMQMIENEAIESNLLKDEYVDNIGGTSEFVWE